MAKLHPTTAIQSSTQAFGIAIPMFVLTAAVAGLLLLQFVPPTDWSPYQDRAISLRLSDVVARFGDIYIAAPRTYSDLILYPLRRTIDLVTVLANSGVSFAFMTHLLAALVVAGIVSRQVFQQVRLAAHSHTVAQHARGPRPLRGANGRTYLIETWQAAIRQTGLGVFLAPGIAMPTVVEKAGILLVGRPGSGKSVILEGLLHQALMRGDRVVALDVKGGLSRRLAGHGPKVLALSGSDCTVWGIGQDLVDDADADEFAAALIPESRDPVWSEGSRLILSALVQYLHERHGANWGWRELTAILAQPVEALEATIRAHAPEIANLISRRAEPAQFVVSLMFNLASHVGAPAKRFARLERQGARPLSLRAWSRPGADRQPIILRYDLQRRERSASFVRLALRILSGTLLGDEIPDGEDTRTWIFADEVTRVGRSEAVLDLAALGRSRGVRLVATVQSPAQLRHVYEEAGSEAFRENFGLAIICGLPPGDNAKRVAEDWIGNRTVFVPAEGSAEARDWTLPCLSPAEIAGELGHDYDLLGRSRIRAAVVGTGDVAVIDWSFGRWSRPA